MEPILTRETIARQADEAARQFASAPAGAEPPPNPFPIASDAAAAWHASFCRYLLLHTSDEVSA